jgi:hypothetical protein
MRRQRYAGGGRVCNKVVVRGPSGLFIEKHEIKMNRKIQELSVIKIKETRAISRGTRHKTTVDRGYLQKTRRKADENVPSNAPELKSRTFRNQTPRKSAFTHGNFFFLPLSKTTNRIPETLKKNVIQ